MGYYCAHSDCRSDSRKNPKMKFAKFVKPSKDPIRAQRWTELMCRANFGLDDISSWTVVCELHFPENVNLDWNTNLDLIPKPHSSCPPGFVPKSNPVPEAWLEKAKKWSKYKQKIIDYQKMQASRGKSAEQKQNVQIVLNKFTAKSINLLKKDDIKSLSIIGCD